MVQAHFFKKPFGTFNSKMVTKQKNKKNRLPLPPSSPPPPAQTLFLKKETVKNCMWLLV